MGLRAIVQSVAAVNSTFGGGTTAAVNMGSAPVNGNLLLAVGIMSAVNGAPAANTGWTVENVDGPAAGGVYVALYSKYAGAGESTNQQPEANARSIWGLHVWEISGVTGVYSSDVLAAHLNANFVVFTTGPATTVAFNTGANNELVLGGIVGNSGGGTQTTLTSTTYTADSGVADPSAPFAAAIGFHVAEPTMGTSVAATVSWSPNVNENVLSCFIELDAGTGSSTETATVNLAIAPMSFTGAGVAVNETAMGTLKIASMAFVGAGAVTVPAAAATLAIGHPTFAVVSGKHDVTTAAIAIGKMAFHAVDIITRVTQYTQQALAINVVLARMTQGALQALTTNTVNARATFMSLLVLAKGGEPPLQPNPLSLMDAGREPVLRQRFVNMYPEPTPQGPGADARYQRGGLYRIAQYGGGPIQAIQHWAGPVPGVDEFLMSFSGGNVYRDNVNIGVIDPFVDPIWFPKGRRISCARSETQFMAASNGKLYSISLESVTQVDTTGNLPAGVRDMAFLGGRFVYILDDDSGEFYYSAIGDGTVIDGLSFATASEDDPLPLLAAWDLSDDICFFTSETVEFWYVSADPNNPYQRSTGRRFNKGLLAKDSVELIDNSLFWLGHDRQIYRTGQIPIKVSNFDIDDRIRRLTDDEVQQCYAYGVTTGGHNFYVIHLMSQGTWACDIASKTWSEWKCYNKDRFRTLCTDDTFRIHGDYFAGNLMGLDGGVYTDMSDPMERVCSAYYPLPKGRHINFNLILHCTRGVGGRVEMRWSDHEGHDWSTWQETSLGEIGDRGEGAKAVWAMLGGMSPPGRLYEFRCTDDCFFAPFKLRVDEERP